MWEASATHARVGRLVQYNQLMPDPLFDSSARTFSDYASADKVHRIAQGYGVSPQVEIFSGAPTEYGRLVLQRAESCKLLLNADSPEETWISTSRALIVYVSFSGELERASCAIQTRTIEEAAKTVLNLPVLTRGQWGDGAKTESALDLATPSSSTALPAPGEISIVVVPQASLSVRAKSGGKGVSYRALASKEAGETLFDAFLMALNAAAAQALEKDRGACASASAHDAHQQEVLRKRAAALVPPAQLFKTGEHAGLYSEYDARGVPIKDANGQDLAKNALKKCEKLYVAHVKNHEKELQRGGVADSATLADAAAVSTELGAKQGAKAAGKPALAPDSPLRLIAGSYGRRQGLSLDAACGPFAHVLVI